MILLPKFLCFMEEKIMERKPKKHLKTISILVLFGLLIFLFFQIKGEVAVLRQDVNDLKIKLLDITIFGKPALIDLTSQKAQKIDDKFTIFIDEVEPHLTGIKIKGGTINTSGIAHKNIKFSVTVAEQTKELHILEEIKSGYSRNFELYVPNVPIEKSKYAKIKYNSSLMAWFEH